MALTPFFRSYSLHRATVAVLSFGAATVGARVLSASEFSLLMTAAFMAKFLQILNLGATNGYFVSRYSGKGILAQDAPGGDRLYLTHFALQMGALGFVVLAVAVLWLPRYQPGAIAFVLLVPVFVTEPFLRYRRNFSFSLVPELVLSLALLSVVGVQLAGVRAESPSAPYLMVIALLGLALLVIAMRRYLSELRGTEYDYGMRSYRQVVALGGPVYLGSALFLLASSMDRLILPLHGSDAQVSIYFLAHQLSVGSMIFVTAINFVNTVNLGEARQNQSVVDRDIVEGKLRSAGLVALGSFVALGVGGFVLETGFLPASFDGLTPVILLLGAGLAVFFTSNAITPIVAYYRRQMPLTVSMGCVALALAANNAFVYWNGLGPAWLAASTGLAFALHGTFSIWFTFKTLRQQAESGNCHAD